MVAIIGRGELLVSQRHAAVLLAAYLAEDRLLFALHFRSRKRGMRQDLGEERKRLPEIVAADFEPVAEIVRPRREPDPGAERLDLVCDLLRRQTPRALQTGLEHQPRAPAGLAALHRLTAMKQSQTETIGRSRRGLKTTVAPLGSTVRRASTGVGIGDQGTGHPEGTRCGRSDRVRR